MAADLALTRRAFATGLSGSLALLGAGEAAAARVGAYVSLTADMRDAALRGLARAGDSGDAVLLAKAEAAVAQLATTDREAALLVRIYRRYDVASWGSWSAASLPTAQADDLAILHSAIADCRPVAFSYTDLDGDVTARTVLPLALVHPAQGVKLLAWCERRAAYRQFFVREMRGLSAGTGGYADRMLALLAGLIDEFAERP